MKSWVFLGLCQMRLAKISELNQSSTEQKRMTSTQEREFKELVKLQKESISALGELGEVEKELASVRNLPDYFSALEKLLSNEALEQSKGDFIKMVLSHRKKFSNDDGELRSKLFVNGPIEIWEKVESGEISLHPNDSRQEYDHIMAMLSRPDLRNIWSYKLVECIPQQTNQRSILYREEANDGTLCLWSR